jgi:hypothetical protein
MIVVVTIGIPIARMRHGQADNIHPQEAKTPKPVKFSGGSTGFDFGFNVGGGGSASSKAKKKAAGKGGGS